MPGLHSLIALISDKTGFDKTVSKFLSIGLIVTAVLLIFFVMIPTAWNSIQGSIIKSKVDEANAEFGQKLDDITGAQDVISDERKIKIQNKIKKTEELIDEALSKDCAVADYITSNGAKCVRINGDTISGT